MADTRVPRSSSPLPASASALSTVTATGWLTPERVAHAEFRSGFRGLDATEVRAFLARVAAELRTLVDRQADLVAELESVEERNSALAAEPLDIHQVSELLGRETARVLVIAREAAADIKTRAEADAATMTVAAFGEAERVRTQAEGTLAERQAEAEAIATEILIRAEAAAEQLRTEARATAHRVRAEAEAEAESLRSESEAAAEQLQTASQTAAEQLRTSSETTAELLRSESEAAAEQLRIQSTETAEELRHGSEASAQQTREEAMANAAATRAQAAEEAATSVAEAEARRAELVATGEAAREAAREEGKRMVGEARAVRERILTDMARRRNVARQQLERVRAARERLLDAIDGVRQGVAEVQAELSGSLVDAKLAGERAARSVDVDDIADLRELEAEVELAKDTGLIDLSALLIRDDELTVLDPTVLDPTVLDPADTGEFAVVGVIDVGTNGGDEGSHEATADDVAEAAPTDGTAAVLALVSDTEAVSPRVVTRASSLGSVPTRPRSAPRAGNIEVSPRQPNRAEGLPLTSVAPAPAAPAGPAEHGAVVELREPAEVAAADSDDAEADDRHAPDNVGKSGGQASPDGGSGAGGEPRRGRRKGKTPTKAEEVFARLRAADEEASAGSSPDRNGRGASAVIGLAVAERRAADAQGAPSDSERHGSVEPGVVEALFFVGESAGTELAGTELAVNSEEDEAIADPDRVALHTRDAVLAGAVRDLSRQLKLALSDQQNELLEANRNLKGAEESSPSAADMTAIFAAAAAGGLLVAWEIGRRSIVADDTVSAQPADVSAHADALSAGIVNSLRHRLAQADDEGQGLWEVDRVRAAYREVRSQRLGELVEFHVYATYAAGQLVVAPAGTPARWVSDACSPDCLDNALASPIEFGQVFPTGHRAPPTFPGCRCLLVAVD